jgi:hypothetical protein
MAERPTRATDELYTVSPAEFVIVRNRLAAKLQRAGRTEDAAAVKRLQKPTPAVWAINQVARLDRSAMARFVELVDRLRRAHFTEPGRLAQAAEEQRAALEALVQQALAALAEAGLRPPAATPSRISATLLGSAADPQARAELSHGRLAEERQAPGFEALEGTPAAPTGAPRREKAPPARPAQSAEGQQRVDRLREALRDAESDARDRRQRAEASEALAAQLRGAAESAARAAEELRQRLQEADRKARDTRRASEEAGRAAERARREADQAEARLRAVTSPVRSTSSRGAPRSGSGK